MISERLFPEYWIITDMMTMRRTMDMMITPHIVGVPFLPAWSAANSVACPMSHSALIFLPSHSQINNLIPYGINISVSMAVMTREESMNMRLDIKNNLEQRFLGK